MAEPTERQLQILNVVSDFTAREGMPPTIAEVSQAIGCSSSGGVRSGIRALITKGFMVQKPRIARGLLLTLEGKTFLDYHGRFAQFRSSSLISASS